MIEYSYDYTYQGHVNSLLSLSISPTPLQCVRVFVRLLLNSPVRVLYGRHNPGQLLIVTLAPVIRETKEGFTWYVVPRSTLQSGYHRLEILCMMCTKKTVSGVSGLTDGTCEFDGETSLP